MRMESGLCKEIRPTSFESSDILEKVKREAEPQDIILNNVDLRKISVRNDIFQSKISYLDSAANKHLKEFKDKFPEKMKCDQCKRWIAYKSSWDIHRRYVCRGRKSTVHGGLTVNENDKNIITKPPVDKKCTSN